METTNKSLAAELLGTTIKFRVNNVSALTSSNFSGPSVSAFGKTFTPVLRVCENKEGRYSTLGFFLECDWPGDAELPQKSCKLKFRCILHSQNLKHNDLTRQGLCSFTRELPSWGFHNYIEWFQLIKPTWMANDSISLEITIEAVKIELEEKDVQVTPAKIGNDNVQVTLSELGMNDVEVQVGDVDTQELGKMKFPSKTVKALKQFTSTVAKLLSPKLFDLNKHDSKSK